MTIFAGQARGFGRRTRRAIRLTRWALIAERAARAFWPALTILGFLAAAALLGAFQWLDPFWHQAALAGIGLTLLGALVVGIFRMRMPRLEDAARRLDRDDPARPLSTLTDRLAVGAGMPATQSIWRAHLDRAERAARRLRARAPEFDLARHDRWALRLFALTLLLGALIAAGPDWRERLRAVAEPGRVPDALAAVPAAPPAADAWATPPAYTGRDTVYFGDLAEGAPVPPLPEGSELTVRVTGFEGLPELRGSALEGVEGFTGFGGGLSEARGVLGRDGDLGVVADGEVLADWRITVIPDQPPEIEPTEPPLRAATGALEVPFRAEDDYGIATAWGEIVPKGGLEPGRGLVDEPITFALPLPIARQSAGVEDRAIHDLSDHPWAGAEVEMVLIAEDGAEQRGTSEVIRLVLPERRFLNPLARALVEQRRALALDFAEAERVLDVLQAVTRRPEEVFESNTGAYMGVRTAIRRLAEGVFQDSVAAQAPDVTELLWLAAVALEDGDLSDALARLRQAEQQLREALESGSDQEVAQALEELRQAMDDYLRQLAERALQNPEMQQGQQMQPGQQLSQQDLQEMLDEIQRNAESGLRDQARDMLSELSRMLENLQAGNPQMQQGGPGQQAMQELQELIQRQRDLADQTFDALREQRRQDGRANDGGSQGEQRDGMQPGDGQQGQSGQGQGDPQGDGQPRLGRDGRPMPGQNGQPGDLAAGQRALEQALERLRQGLPGGPDDPTRQALEEAGRAMGEATSDLERDRNADAVEDQMEALDRLNEGANALAQQIQEGQGDTAAEGRRRGNQGPAQDSLETDPFDRPAGSYGAIDGRDTEVPDRSALDRAREVLEELRRRSAEPGRPELELDYFDRLMDSY